MVKFGKNKFKALNKVAKHQKTAGGNITNKVLKKKINAEKKVSFQKEVLLKQAATGGSPLVKTVSSKQVLFDDLSKKEIKSKSKTEGETKPKLRPVEKHKKRQKTQISDAKLLFKLMKK